MITNGLCRDRYFIRLRIADADRSGWFVSETVRACETQLLQLDLKDATLEIMNI
ncbi:hypothetical protein OIPHN069_46900 (plasmid) [Enterobacter hormaechei subsp. hoffmannii]|nr:hypothetical protein OIPHN069_46900 [Enterobacter hormaechei subsp. hoffmannii]BDJ93514.1 hypothetical protein FJMB80067_47170 [Enterobacter hormaechei]BDK23290.1 hypothetical protein FJMB80379_50360 [Enterobacter hormaechei]